MSSFLKTKQGWHTSAVAMHLVIARLLSMSVIFCLLLTSNTCCDFKQQLWFRYFLYITYFKDLCERQMWELWIQFCLTLLLHGTRVNNNGLIRTNLYLARNYRIPRLQRHPVYRSMDAKRHPVKGGMKIMHISTKQGDILLKIRKKNTNKQALSQHPRAAYAWHMKFNKNI